MNLLRSLLLLKLSIMRLSKLEHMVRLLLCNAARLRLRVMLGYFVLLSGGLIVVTMRFTSAVKPFRLMKGLLVL